MACIIWYESEPYVIRASLENQSYCTTNPAVVTREIIGRDHITEISRNGDQNEPPNRVTSRHVISVYEVLKFRVYAN